MLQGPQGYGIHGRTIQAIARELKEVHDLGVVEESRSSLAAKYFAARGKKDLKLTSTTGDYMGMMAYCHQRPRAAGRTGKRRLYTRVQSAYRDCNRWLNRFNRRRAMRHLEKGGVVIFGAGTGNP